MGDDLWLGLGQVEWLRLGLLLGSLGHFGLHHRTLRLLGGSVGALTLGVTKVTLTDTRGTKSGRDLTGGLSFDGSKDVLDVGEVSLDSTDDSVVDITEIV